MKMHIMLGILIVALLLTGCGRAAPEDNGDIDNEENTGEISDAEFNEEVNTELDTELLPEDEEIDIGDMI